MNDEFSSLYEKTSPPADRYPSLEGDLALDVAIVGGGFTGVSTALHLAEAGVSAALLEAETVGWGASGRNGGQVNPGLYPSPRLVIDRFGDDMGRRMIDLAYNAPGKVFALADRLGLDCEARQTGTLRAAVTAAAQETVAALAETCRSLDMPTRLLDREAIAEVSGTGRYRAALLDPRGGTLNPLAYVRGLARAASSAGAALFETSRAVSLTREGERWRLSTGKGSLLARHVVLATNGYTDGLWPGLRRSVVPAFSAITATDPLDQALTATILPKREVLYEVGWTTVYYRVDQAGRLLMGGRGPQRPPRGDKDFAHLRAYARRLFPALAEAAFPYAWSGQVAMTADHLPHLAELAPNCHAALGYNGRGIAMATAMGEILAHRVRGAPASALAMPIAASAPPVRFHRFWPLGVVARIHYGRLRDRLDR